MSDPGQPVAEGEAARDAEADERVTVDALTDELSLVRAQLDSALPGLAEGTARRRLARLEASGSEAAADEMDALRLLLAEALWRQGRPAPARAALGGMRTGSTRRHLPIAMLIEAESLAAAAEVDRANGVAERLLAAVGPDEVFALRRGTPGRPSWPLPSMLRVDPPPPPSPPWSRPAASRPVPSAPPDGGRVALARSRLEEARAAYVAGDRARGDAQLSVALRLDPEIAADGVRLLEPTLEGQPAADRLLLYGDLLRAAGREAEATAAFDRAADRRG